MTGEQNYSRVLDELRGGTHVGPRESALIVQLEETIRRLETLCADNLSQIKSLTATNRGLLDVIKGWQNMFLELKDKKGL